MKVVQFQCLRDWLILQNKHYSFLCLQPVIKERFLIYHTGCSMMTSCTHQSIGAQSNAGPGLVTSNLSKLVIPLILWRRSDDKLLQSMTSWMWEVSLGGHGMIRKVALNKHNLSVFAWVCACICQGDSSRSQFYEWKEGICHFFTIFGQGAVQRGKLCLCSQE